MTHIKKQKRLDADALLEFMKAHVTEPTREYRIHGMQCKLSMDHR